MQRVWQVAGCSCERDNVKRRLLIVAVFLLAGAVVNVAVAWGCALGVLPFLPYSAHDDHNYVDEAHSTWWRENAPSTWEGDLASVSRVPGFGTLHLMYAQYATEDEKRTLGSTTLVFRLFAGIPFRCLEGSSWVDRTAGTVRSDSLVHVSRRWWRPAGNIPLRFRWAETSANILFYTVVFVGIRLVYLSIRARIRLRRGLCPACAYPMGESDTCSECGKPLPNGRATT